jgi:hypothetical protein
MRVSDERDAEREAARRRAITEATVRDIVRALAPYGVLGHDALAEACRADRWDEGAFDSALRAAVREGVVEELPEGYYKLIR